ncbi:hypothetical protein SAMN04490248_1444 [Salinihabitans flavidus]|uniref:Uncharacterized protein n=1 Tax=Salinihabitans flavidus TaxID=569882 RepID=A0A1H8W562_9RHOB|nr:hypothetical protein SAMN04490248_1444 [Salinihabitans flavidus]
MNRKSGTPKDAAAKLDCLPLPALEKTVRSFVQAGLNCRRHCSVFLKFS